MAQQPKTLLLIIDLQKGWRHKLATEAAMLRTVQLCRSFKGDIIHCCFKNDPDSLFHKQLNWKRFVNAEDTDEIPEIAQLKLPKYRQHTYNRVNDETLPVLKRYKQVFVAGVFTDISVFVTAMDIFDKNIPVGVVVDCVATLHGEDVHKAALKSLDFSIGKDALIQSDELLRQYP